MKNWFDEKAGQVSAGTLTAFDIKLTSRYSKADELAELLLFAKDLALSGLHVVIKEAFYDSKSSVCSFEFAKELNEFSPEALEVFKIAETNISSFEWFGRAYHNVGPDDDFPH